MRALLSREIERLQPMTHPLWLLSGRIRKYSTPQEIPQRNLVAQRVGAFSSPPSDADEGPVLERERALPFALLYRYRFAELV